MQGVKGSGFPLVWSTGSHYRVVGFGVFFVCLGVFWGGRGKAVNVLLDKTEFEPEPLDCIKTT